MSNVPLKTKNRVIISYINGKKLEDISFEERVALNNVEEIISEWKQGFLTTELTIDIAPELKELATLMRDKEISVHDVVEGYHYYNIFKEKEKEKVIRIVNELYSLTNEKREKFINTAEKMMTYSKYEKVEYADIPKALEEMVAKGKEINKEIKSKEILNLEMTARLESIKKEIDRLDREKENLKKEINFANYMKVQFPNEKEDEDAIKKVLEAIKHSDFNLAKMEEVSSQIILIKNRNLTVDQFLKVSRYFEELMNLGVTVQFMEKLLDQVKEYDMSVDEYLNERALYVKDKQAYTRSVKELIDTHKKAEKQLKLLNEQIALKKMRVERL